MVSLNGFKGSLTNLQACNTVAKTLKKLDIPTTTFPISDGGRGTIEMVQSVKKGQVESFEVSGPLKGKVQASVLCLPDAKAPNTILIESSEACGYHLVDPQQRDALRASSVGLGELLAKSIEKWKGSLKKIYVGLGDSIVSDAGMGMLSALGVVFRDTGGKPIWGNAHGLRLIQNMDLPKWDWFRKIEIVVLCDVLNPLCGAKGTARTFAPQKGATPGQVTLIEEGIEKFAKLVEESLAISIRYEPMTGSAGGLAAAFKAFLKAKLVHGAPFLLDWLGFDEILKEHKFVITGEGKTDAQTLSGKAPYEAFNRAERQGKKTLFVSGTVGTGLESLRSREMLAGIYSCGQDPSPEKALAAKIEELFSDTKLLKSLGA